MWINGTCKDFCKYYNYSMSKYYNNRFDVVLVCEQCKKKFPAYSKKKKGKRTFCSLSCLGKWHQTNSSGANNYNWKGGKYTDKRGYIILTGNRVNGKRTSQMEHRLIMEKHLKRKLYQWEDVHHLNGIKNDNRIKNLKLVLKKKHYGNIKCPYCSKCFLIK